MKTFHKLLVTGLIVSATNNYVWFALTYWIYLQTRSVIATGVIAGLYLVATVSLGFWFGALVDHNKKKHVMLGSSCATIAFFIAGLVVYTLTPASAFSTITSPILWVFAVLLLGGTLAGNLYGIAIPTLVTVLVPEDKRDKANGLFGTVMGLSFAITAAASGLVLGFFGMHWVLISAVLCTVIAIGSLLIIAIPEKHIVHTAQDKDQKIDIKGTFLVIKAIPGLLGLMLFNTFNNFLGGAFMALMDAYGLNFVSVQIWSLMWAVLSFSFILGGLAVSKFGLGKNPLRTLFLATIVMWSTCILFPIQPSIVLLFFGILLWMALMPIIEAAEQTILQKVVPPERQGRVFGFAQSVEQSASPLSAFLMGPITQLFFIPFMTTGDGAHIIGSWFGVGEGRGIALVFVLTGIIGLFVTILCMQSSPYRKLSKKYLEK